MGVRSGNTDQSLKVVDGTVCHDDCVCIAMLQPITVYRQPHKKTGETRLMHLTRRGPPLLADSKYKLRKGNPGQKPWYDGDSRFNSNPHNSMSVRLNVRRYSPDSGSHR